MAAATSSATRFNLAGDMRISYAVLTSPTDGQTWDSGLRLAEAVFVQQTDAVANAVDAVTVTISGGIVTLHIAGIIDSCYILGIGT